MGGKQEGLVQSTMQEQGETERLHQAVLLALGTEVSHRPRNAGDWGKLEKTWEQIIPGASRGKLTVPGLGQEPVLDL